MNNIEQQFFSDLEKKLWTAADKLRSNLDAAVYKHVVLGLIFLKYVSDAFEERQKELREQFQNPDHDYYMAPEEYGGAGTQEYEENLAAELEVRDYYTEKNVFWVPLEARWQTLYKVSTAVSKLLIINREIRPGRITMIIVKEKIGF